MASLRVADSAYNNIYNQQANPIAKPAATTPANTKTTNIAGQPTYQRTAGMLGSYSPGRNWDKNLAEIGKTVNKSTVGSYKAPAEAQPGTPQAQQNQAYSAAQNQAKIAAPTYAGYQQKNLQQGFSDDYLQKLSASQVDPLKEQYEESLRLAGADFNRMGLGGSGFEVGAKYGDQPGSITSRYLQEIGNVARDVALRGAEAEREDAYRLADMNEAARQNWAGFDTNLAQQNFGNQQAMLDAASRMTDQDEAARQFWAKDELDRDLATRDYQLKAIDTARESDQQDQANQQWWLNFQQQQLSADDQAMMDRWKSLSEIQQWDAELAEKSRQFDTTSKLSADQMNAQIKNQNIDNMINFLNSQSKTAESMQNAYWDSINQGNNIANTSSAANAQSAAWLRDLFKTR